jgi:hypothetical protein
VGPGRRAAAAVVIALTVAGAWLLGDAPGSRGAAGEPASDPPVEAVDARMLLDLDLLQDLELLRELPSLRALERLDRPDASRDGGGTQSP